MAQMPDIRRPKKAQKVEFSLLDPNQTLALAQADEDNSLQKSVLNLLNSGKVERLAFEQNPDEHTEYFSIYKPKLRLLPAEVIKRIAIQDDLVAAICTSRANHVKAFGREQVDRYSTGYRIEPRPGVLDAIHDEQVREQLLDRIDKASKLLSTCGRTTGWKPHEQMSFSTYLAMTARDAVSLGQFATEIIWALDMDGERKFHSFRPADAGTMFKAVPKSEATEQVRQDALRLLERIKNDRLEPERFENDEYAWIQVINGQPRQAFTGDEMVVVNCYPVTNVELNGYPLSPLDTVIAAVTTHINITSHNKMYFQTGRAAKGMLVIKSADVDDKTVKTIRQQFNASINGIANSWRMPVFGVGPEDEIAWQPIDQAGSRDMEFQYLSDQNARVIMSAFQMSPEELPGYAHLCLHPDTKIWTEGGIASIGDLLGEEKEVGGFKVWTGKGWEDARAFVTGMRQVCKTGLSNGVSLITSPDHLFRVIDNQGNLAWRRQKDLSLRDHVLINRNPLPGSEANIPSYGNKKLTPEMMEVLGWLTGDGSIIVRKRGKVHHSKELELYYHHDKEIQIRQRHADIMSAFGLNPLIRDRKISQTSIEKNKVRCGFKSIHHTRQLINLHDTEFVEWLLGLGFTPSTDRKTIPAFIHGLPVEYRGAFLRGFFSADGSKDKLDTPSITIADDRTREETKLLLAGMGIRTRLCEGTHRLEIKKINGGDAYRKRYVRRPSRLIIKDKREFYSRIGFLQDHKQPTRVLEDSECRWDKVPRSIAVWLADRILSTVDMGGEEREHVRHTLKDPKYDNQVRSKVLEFASRYKIELPSWLNEYHYEQVTSLEIEDREIEMVDIEVFDNEHAFTANGVVVHNSRGTNSQALAESNNEFKLQAARDVGIRPLLAIFQDFLNDRILPLIDPIVAKTCWIRLVGLDADTPEREAIRADQDQKIYETMNGILARVEKDPIDKEFGGDLILNPLYHANVLDKYLTVGEILEKFFGRKGASKDPMLAYRRDPFWFNQVQLQMQMEQMKMQQQAAQQQAQQAQPPQGGDGDRPPPKQDDGGGEEGDLSSGLDQLIKLMQKSELSKAEKQLPPGKRKLVKQHEFIVKKMLDEWEADAKKATEKIANEIARTLPKQARRGKR